MGKPLELAAPGQMSPQSIRCRPGAHPEHFRRRAASYGERLAMTLQFHRAVEGMEIWSASSDGFSFVITYESPSGPGFHGRTGYVASWRPLHQSRGAINIGGSPFKTLAEAEQACDTILAHLTEKS
jgi:hypothetical protein